MTLDVDKPASRASRLLYPAFIASLAINLLVVGGIATAAWHHHSSKSGDYGMMTFARELQPEHRDAFRQSVLAVRLKVKDLRSVVRQKWLDANALLTVEPFDRAKFEAALTELRVAENEFRTVLNSSLADKAASLTPDERKSLRKWREKRRPRFLRHADRQDSKSSSETNTTGSPGP